MNRAAGPTPLEARGISFSFARPVVRDFSLRLARGAVTGIIGPNGCGKTTVLRLLDGILRPAAGEVVLAGELPLHQLTRKEIARRIAMVPQNAGINPYQTVFQFAMQGRSPHLPLLGFESQRDEDLTLEALEMMQMDRLRHSRVAEISGGEKQRLLLARALVQRTEILLLDEFTANLDINYQVELMHLIARITRQNNLATLVVSHEINLLATYSDHIVLMAEGTAFGQGPAREVLTRNNLKQVFGLDFTVRELDGAPEILPIMKRNGR